ncbi:MAG: hypothetical protein RL318_2007, partial [Fibrobacterota bacterium]
MALAFPNARQGVEYRQEIALPSGGILVSGRCEPAGCGLLVDVANGCVTGIPDSSGDVAVTVTVKTDAGVLGFSGSIYVNADPRSLWKNIPSSKDEPFWKPDAASQEIRSVSARLLAGRCRGRSHAHAGTCCDDDFFLSVAGDWHVAIVADGAGSASFSRLGSRTAVQTAGSFLDSALAGEHGQNLSNAAFRAGDAPDDPEVARAVRDALWRTVGGAAHAAVAALIATTDESSGIQWKDLSTTLLIAVTRKVGNRRFCGSYWVGDGALAVWSASTGTVTPLGEVDAGEYSGQTRFLAPEEVDATSLARRLRFAVCDSMDALVLMTDGVSDPWFESESSLADAAAWRRFWDEIEPLLQPAMDGSAPSLRLESWLDF